jgi:hypothetical protein
MQRDQGSRKKRKNLIKSETQNTKVYMEGHTVQTFHWNVNSTKGKFGAALKKEKNYMLTKEIRFVHITTKELAACICTKGNYPKNPREWHTSSYHIRSIFIVICTTHIQALSSVKYYFLTFSHLKHYEFMINRSCAFYIAIYALANAIHQWRVIEGLIP